MRIVSLFPAATEIVCALGLEDHLAGISHQCDWPTKAMHLPRVTRGWTAEGMTSAAINAAVAERIASAQGLYELDEELLASLAPDLILTQGVCDVCAMPGSHVSEAAATSAPAARVLNLDAHTLRDVMECVRAVADACGVPERGARFVARLNERIYLVARRTHTVLERPKVLLLEWIDPPFSGGHWSPELVRIAGGTNCIGREGEHSRAFDWGDALVAAPDVMIVACCGMTVERTSEEIGVLRAKPGFEDLPCARNGRVFLMDGGAYFSRPGPRLVDALEMMAHALHPMVHQLPDGLTPAVPLDDIRGRR